MSREQKRKPIKSDVDARNAKPEDTPYRRPAGHGLYLEVRPTGTKLWRYRYRLPDATGIRRENMFAVGQYGKGGRKRGEFTLLEALTERARLRELVKQGRHPVQDRREEKRAVIAAGHNTFQSVAIRWLDIKRATKSARYVQQIERVFEADVYPAIGDRPISTVGHADLSEIVDARAVEAPSMALLIQQWCGAIFRFAMKRGLASQDPSYILRGSVEKPPVKHKTPLVKSDFPAFFTALEESGGNRTTKAALKLLLYTFVRPGEMCGAKWAEFDLESATWKIPKARMKRGVEHWVPLSRQAVKELRELHKLTGGQKWLFPNLRDEDKSLTTNALRAALERMGYAGRFSAHGFRATASTALNDLGFRYDWIEIQLAHKERDRTRGSYNQATYWEPRQEMMQKWADIIHRWAKGEEAPANVTHISVRAA